MDCMSSVTSSWVERQWIEVSRGCSRIVSVSLKSLEEATFVAQSNFARAETEAWTVCSRLLIQPEHQQRILLKSSLNDGGKISSEIIFVNLQ